VVELLDQEPEVDLVGAACAKCNVVALHCCSAVAHRAPLIAGAWAAAAAAAWAAEDDCEAVAHIAHDVEGQAQHVGEATHSLWLDELWRHKGWQEQALYCKYVVL
jgi:hypothetical protein